MNLDENVGVTNDSYLGLNYGNDEDNWLQFYQPGAVYQSQFFTKDPKILEYKLQQNFVFKRYERTLVNVIDVLAYLGAMFSSLSLIGLVFNMTFSYNLLLSSLIRKLYYFKPKFEKEIKKKKEDKTAPKTFAEEEG